MAIRKIARLGHPVLRRVSETVEYPVSDEIARLAEDMRDTLAEIGGTGLAAPQVYENKRLVVFRMPANRIPPGADVPPTDFTTMVNPVLTPLVEEKTTAWERCLSVPGLHGRVPRYPEVEVAFTDLSGREVILRAKSVLAFLLQHECDHLDGIVYPMRMKDLSDLEFDTDPGRLMEDRQSGFELDPLFAKLVDAWPDGQRWFSKPL